jgi:hypothetical protein
MRRMRQHRRARPDAKALRQVLCHILGAKQLQRRVVTLPVQCQVNTVSGPSLIAVLGHTASTNSSLDSTRPGCATR